MSRRIAFTGTNGESLAGEFATPSGSGRSGSLVLVHEWWGVNDHVRSLVDRFAAEGFVVLAPDLFYGKVAKSAAEAERLMNALERPRAVREIAAAAEYLKEHSRSNGKVAVTGFCMGGALTFAAAAFIPGLAAAVPFYGLPGDAVKDWSKVTAPILAHFAKRDGWATASGAQAIQKAIDSHGKTMELYLYDADHAFVNDTRPEVHDPANAKLALERTYAFLKKNLS